MSNIIMLLCPECNGKIDILTHCYYCTKCKKEFPHNKIQNWNTSIIRTNIEATCDFKGCECCPKEEECAKQTKLSGGTSNGYNSTVII